MTLSDALKIELLREMLPEGWEIVRAGETAEAPPDEFQGADWLHCGVDAIRRHRTNGTGPLFLKLGRSVVYTTADLADWVQSQKRHKSTAG